MVSVTKEVVGSGQSRNWLPDNTDLTPRRSGWGVAGVGECVEARGWVGAGVGEGRWS